MAYVHPRDLFPRKQADTDHIFRTLDLPTGLIIRIYEYAAGEIANSSAYQPTTPDDGRYHIVDHAITYSPSLTQEVNNVGVTDELTHIAYEAFLTQVTGVIKIDCMPGLFLMSQPSSRAFVYGPFARSELFPSSGKYLRFDMTLYSTQDIEDTVEKVKEIVSACRTLQYFDMMASNKKAEELWPMLLEGLKGCTNPSSDAKG